jgi:methylated-DNA-[protein]-cysteine S-methyltransferase
MPHYTTPFGKIHITLNQNIITHIDFNANEDTSTPLPPTIQQAFDAYFNNKQRAITLPTQLTGTPFQIKVWQTLQTIPAGETWSYGKLAKELGSHPRAIGQACKRNPIPLIYPCHRIVAQNNLGGFAGARKGKLLTIKQWLLTFEGGL